MIFVLEQSQFFLYLLKLLTSMVPLLLSLICQFLALLFISRLFQLFWLFLHSLQLGFDSCNFGWQLLVDYLLIIQLFLYDFRSCQMLSLHLCNLLMIKASYHSFLFLLQFIGSIPESFQFLFFFLGQLGLDLHVLIDIFLPVLELLILWFHVLDSSLLVFLCSD